MGWLDNSTNNIILDAVLTDFGRQTLARNDNSFRIAKFSLGDDEVNYGTITKYGRTIGREKIEKNTPIFEAFTNQNIALKYKLMSSPRPLLYLPKFSLGNNFTTVELSAAQNGVNTFTVNMEQAMSSNAQSTIPDDFIETNFDVFVPDLFLTIQNTPAVSTDNNRISLYNLSTTSTNNLKPQLSFILSLRSIAEATWSVYSTTIAGVKTISTQVRIVGVQSGAVLEIPITIKKS
jgi:hypothetical protein